MIKIRLDVGQINYEKSLENLLPRLYERYRGEKELSILKKLIVRLGDDAVPVAKQLFKYLDTDARDQILIWAVNSHSEQLADSLSRHIAEAFSGAVIVMGAIQGKDVSGPGLTLYASNVSIDYDELIKSPMLSGGVLKGAARTAIQLANPETREKTCISLLSSALVKSKLISIIAESLQKAGLVVTLQDIELQIDNAIRLSGPGGEAHREIPDAIEDLLLDAFVSVLTDRSR